MDAPLLTVKEAVELSDGRRLSFSAIGPRDGIPILYLHGAIGSPPLRDTGLERVIAGSRIRYLMVDRPGFGGSDPHPGRQVADFARDIGELADALQLRRFSMLGVSAGAPYALACGAEMPGRVAAIAAVSAIPTGFRPRRSNGTALPYRLSLMALLGRPRSMRRTIDAALALALNRPRMLSRLFALGAAGGDRDILSDPRIREIAARRFLAAIEHGSAPMIDDYLVCCADWGFELGAVAPPVHLWHGVRDGVIPYRAAQRMGRRLPDCRPRFIKAGHFFLRSRIAEVIRPLAKAAATPSEYVGYTDRLAA